MLYLPATNQRSKRGLYGLVTSSGASGPWMRRLSFPVQTNTAPAVNWRHVFLTTKQNWLSLASGGAGYVLTDGVSPQSAWAMEAGYYFGIMEAGLNENGVITMSRLIGCSTPDAYYTMVQANRASLGLDPLPTPSLMTGALAGIPVAPPPVFAFPRNMSCATDYDTSYNVIGFYLNYTWVEAWTYPASPWVWNGTGWASPIGADRPGTWEICASDQYASSYSPPHAASWKPILFSGPNMPSAAAVLAAWKVQYGDLKASGNIKFQAFYIDPDTGSSGPALSATANWEFGTLKGADIAVFAGPHFYAWNWNPGTFDYGPSGPIVEMRIQGMNGYSGDIAFSGENSYNLPNGIPPGKTTLPDGAVITLTPASLTISPGDTSIHPVTATFVLPPDTPNYELHLKIKATDGKQTGGASNIIQIVGGTGTLLNWNYLTIDPANASPTCANPGNTILALTLSNTGPDDFAVTMSATADHDDVFLEFASFSPGAASSTSTSITFGLANGLGGNGLLGQTVSSAGYAPDGYNVRDAVVTSSTDTSVTVTVDADPGAMTVEGQVGLPNTAVTVPAGTMASPGTASIGMLLGFPGNFPTIGVQIQVVANCGANTAHSGVMPS